MPNVTDFIEKSGNVTLEPTQPVITGADVTRQQNAIDAAKGNPFESIGKIVGAVSGAIEGISKGQDGAGSEVARDQGTQAGQASVSRDENGQLQIRPHASTMFGGGMLSGLFGGGGGGGTFTDADGNQHESGGGGTKAYEHAAAAGAAAAGATAINTDIAEAIPKFANDPAGFKKWGDDYVAGIPGRTQGSGVTGAVTQHAQQRIGQTYDNMIVNKGAKDIKDNQGAIESKIETDTNDAFTLAAKGGRSAPEGSPAHTAYMKAHSDAVQGYQTLLENKAFGLTPAQINEKLDLLEVNMIDADNQGAIDATYGKPGGGAVAAAKESEARINAAPHISEANRELLRRHADARIRFQGGQFADRVKANDGALETLKDGVASGKISSANAASMVGDIVKEAEVTGSGSTTGRDAISWSKARHFAPEATGLSPSQTDKEHGVGVPVAAANQSNFNEANKQLHLTPQEQALYQRHLGNLEGPGGVDNPDGSRSTIRQVTFEQNGKVYNIPTVWDGKSLSPGEAVARAKKEGIEQFPSYKTEKEAEARYQTMHTYMDKDVGDSRERKAAAGKGGTQAAGSKDVTQAPASKGVAQAPAALETAPGRSVNMNGVNSQLAESVAAGATHLPPGYKVQVIEGFNAAGHVAGSHHHKGNAIDIQIVDPQGNIIPNKGADTTGMYQRLHNDVAGEAQSRFGIKLGHGINFGTVSGGNVPDLMHFDMGGPRGRLNPDIHIAGVPGVAYGQPSPGKGYTAPGKMGQAAGTVYSIIDQAAGGDKRIGDIVKAIYEGESEHSGKYDIGDNGASFGPFQLNVAGGRLGAQFQKETGLDPRDPSTVPQQAAYVVKYIKEHPNQDLSKVWFGLPHGQERIARGQVHPNETATGSGGDQPVAANGKSSPGGFTHEEYAKEPFLLSNTIRTMAEDGETRLKTAQALGTSLTRIMNDNQLPNEEDMHAYTQTAPAGPERDKLLTQYEGLRALQQGGTPSVERLERDAAAKGDYLHKNIAITLREGNDRSKAQLENDPSSYGESVLGIPKPGPINYADPQSVVQGFTARGSTAARIAETEPGFFPSAIPKPDLQGFKVAAASGDPAQQLGVVAGLASIKPGPVHDATFADPAVRGALLAATRSPDGNVMQAAFALLDREFRANPVTFDADWKGASKELSWYQQSVESGKNIGEMVKERMIAEDPGTTAAREALGKQADKNLEKVTIDDVAGKLVGSWWTRNLFKDYKPTSDVPGQTQGAMLNDYVVSYKEHFQKYNNDAAATDYATKQTSLKWGTSATNNGRLMAWPPERSPALPVINESKDWVKAQADEDVRQSIIQTFQTPAVSPEEQIYLQRAPYVLVPDKQTGIEMNSGAPPSYRVVVQDKDGRMNVLNGPGGNAFRWSANPKKAKAAQGIQDNAQRVQEERSQDHPAVIGSGVGFR